LRLPDLKTRVEPRVSGDAPNCAECGGFMSMGMHWLGEYNVLGPLRARYPLAGSRAVGRSISRFRRSGEGLRSDSENPQQPSGGLVQIQ
jgi:hypothetical protein